MENLDFSKMHVLLNMSTLSMSIYRSVDTLHGTNSSYTPVD